MPFFGLRQEIEAATHPNIDPTMVAVFKIETFDRSNGEQRVIGYSFFPFFMDKNIKAPITKASEKKYVLQNGNYQLPVFSDHPNLDTPIKIEELVKLQKLPCSTLLIRVEKSPRDADNNPLRYSELKENRRYELGVVTVPPKYSQGLYNTIYCQLSLTEAEILKDKVQRADPGMMQVAAATKDILFNKSQLTIPELRVWLEGVFNNHVSSANQRMLNYNFFSQYIPRIGLRFAVEMLFNADPEFIYVVILSAMPPGNLYQKKPRFKEAIMITDIDYKSAQTAQKFHETLYTFKNLPSNHRTTFIVDIKAIKFKNKGVALMENYGWTAFPVFDDLETDDNPGTLELYVNSGLYMMPLFEGQINPDFINTMASKDKPYEY